MIGTLETLAWNSIIVVPMVATIWLASRTRLLRDRPAVCHVLWLFVLLKLVTPPVIPVPVLSPQAQPESAAIVQDAPGDHHGLAVGRFTGASQPAVARDVASKETAGSRHRAERAGSQASVRAGWRPSLLDVLVGISLTISAGLWWIAARRFIQIHSLIRSHVCAPRPVMEVVRELLPLFRIRKQPRLIVVDESIAPMLWAAPRRATIALPREVVESMPEDQLRSVIGHELAHYARRDHWAHLFSFLVTSLLWWHPVAWLARREMSAAAEACCDAMVLKRLAASRKAYARTLLSIVDFISANRPSLPALALTFGESHSLKWRMAMVANRDVKARISLAGRMLLAVVVVMLSLFPARGQEAASQSEPSPAAGARPSDDENAATDPKEAIAGDRAGEPEFRLFDGFDEKFELNWEPVRPDPTHVSLAKNPGKLTITTQKGTLGFNEIKRGEPAKNLYLIRNPAAEGGDFVLTMCIESFKPTTNFQGAGLIVYDDDDSYVSCRMQWGNGRIRFNYMLETDQRRTLKRDGPTPSTKRSWIRITKRGKFYERSYSTDGKQFISCGEVAWGNGAPKWVGITAGNGLKGADDIDACFDFFEARSLTDAEKNDPNYLDRKKLRGRWDVVSCQLSGKSLGEASFGQFVFDDASVTIKEKTKSIKTGYTLDATKGPKGLVLSALSSRVKRPVNGVYSLEGDTLVICLALQPDAPAPTKLETKDGDSQMLIKLQRASEEREEKGVGSLS